MDKLINAGISAGKDYIQNQGQGQGQGQGQQQGSGQSGGNKPSRADDDDLQNVHKEASKLAGSSGSSELFSQIAGAIGQRKGQIANEDVDEEDAARKHKQTYEGDSKGDESSLGAAAAMQAFKLFTQGGSGGGSGGSKGGQGAVLALAMSEASKLFDDKASKGKLPDGASKESVIQKAGEMAMKLYFKNQAKSQGGLMGMASQFM